MQKIRMDHKKNFGNVFLKLLLSLLLFAILFLFLGFYLTPDFFLKFSIDKELKDSTIQNINHFRVGLHIISVLSSITFLLLVKFRDSFTLYLDRHKSLIRGFLLLIIIIFSFFLIGEIICRILFFDSTSNFGIGPGTIKFYQKYVHLNTEGMREIPFNLTKYPNTTRIIVIGDSYTFGFGIKNVNNTFPKLLEKKLEEKNNSHKYEVLNFGVPGKSTEEELGILKEKGLKYNPDIVIIGYVLNDFRNIDPVISSQQFSWKTIPYVGFFLREFSYFYFYLETNINQIFLKYMKTESYESSIIKDFNSSINLEYNKKTFVDLANVINKNNITGMVIIFPMLYSLENYSFIQAHDFVRQSSDENGFYVLDMLDYYKKYNEGDLVVSKYDAHPNELAHNIASEEIYQKLINTGLVN